MQLQGKCIVYKSPFVAMGHFLKATVDTGSPASFVNKTTVEYIVKSVHAAVVINEKECPIDTVYVNYSRKRIELLSSLGWNVKSAKFLISENRTCCLLGLDLQSQFGVRTTQVRSPRLLVGEISQSDTNETSEFWRLHYQKKFKNVFFSRIGRTINLQVSPLSSRRSF